MLLGYKPLTWSVQSPSLAFDKGSHLLFCFIYLHKNIINVSCVQIHVLFSLIHYARVLLNFKPQNYSNYFYQSIRCLVLN